MKKNKTYLLIVIFNAFCFFTVLAQPPYSGTIFIDPHIITSSDPTTFVSSTYTGQGMRVVYDRRVPAFITINAYLFDIVWSDGITSEAQINPEFGSVAAASIEATKYGTIIGRLPTCLRVDVDAIWIHKGVNPFGGGNKSILIHTGQSASYEIHNVSYKNMGKNLEDHRLAILELGRKYAWIDTTKVGIFGHSAGGYDAGHAMLEYPDFYKVAVASSADHDFRMEKDWWPEMYMGWPVDSTYHQVSNITMASKLKGKLLITHGGIDENVNPSATFKLAEALIKNNKEFDMLILPSQRHGYQGIYNDYFTKKKWNYFVEHLRGVKPIWDFEIK